MLKKVMRLIQVQQKKNILRKDLLNIQREKRKKEYNKTSTVRDSVTALLQDNIIPTGDFIHLYDSTP